MSVKLVGLFSSHANELRKARRHLSTEPVRELPQANGGRKRTTQPRLSDEKVNQIVTAYETGKTVYELAAELRCHRVTISAVLKRQGVALGSLRRPLHRSTRWFVSMSLGSR